MSNYKEYGWDRKIPSSQSYLYRGIRKLLSDSNQCILDVGCGNGKLANKLLEEGYNIYGIDASEEGIIIANEECKEKGRFFVCDVESNKLPIELQEKKFDTIISTEVIEHIYAPRNYIKFCKAVMSTEKEGGGILIISTPYHGYLKNLVLSLLGQMDYHFHVLWDGGHIKFWSKKTLTKLLEEQGVEDIEFRGCGRFPFLWKSMVLRGRVRMLDAKQF